MKWNLSLVLRRLQKIDLPSHLLRFTLICHLLRTEYLQTINHMLLSAASNLSVAFFVFCHIEQVFLKDLVMDWREQQNWTKCFTPQSVSSKTFMSVSSPSLMLCPASQHEESISHVTANEGCDLDSKA